jgi:hypothetical protein
MAAVDLFETVVKELADRERQQLSDLILSARSDMFAARSEEARVRIVNEFIRDAHDFARAPKR